MRNSFTRIGVVCTIFLFTVSWPSPCLLSAADMPGKAVAKAQEVPKSNPPAETPSGTKPAEPANPGQNPAKPAEPGNSVKPEDISNPSEPANPGNPPEQTPSGTKPAEPAVPGESPATPAEPGNKGKPAPDKDIKDENKPDSQDKDAKEVKEKPTKGGKSGGDIFPASGAPVPQGGGASLAPAAAGLVGGILAGGEKGEDKKKEAPLPESSEVVVPKSSETVKVEASVQLSTMATAAAPLYSAGKGPKVGVLDFDGEYGSEFAALVCKNLSPEFKIYNPEALSAKKYDVNAVTRISARRIAAETGVEYLVTGKVSKKTGTLSIISVFLRDGQTGDVKMTDYQNLKSADGLKMAAEAASLRIKSRLAELR